MQKCKFYHFLVPLRTYFRATSAMTRATLGYLDVHFTWRGGHDSLVGLASLMNAGFSAREFMPVEAPCKVTIRYQLTNCGTLFIGGFSTGTCGSQLWH